jgi:hypothetical protein
MGPGIAVNIVDSDQATGMSVPGLNRGWGKRIFSTL